MKKLTSIIAIAFLMTLGFNAVAQNNATGNAHATLITPLVITNTETLEFGTISAGHNGGTVTISADGTVNHTGTVQIPGFSETSVGIFSVEGESNNLYNISLPASATLTNQSSGETMTINAFTTDKTDNRGQLNNGQDEFNVGATLTISSGQATGEYQGTYEVTVAYN